MVDHWSIQFCF